MPNEPTVISIEVPDGTERAAEFLAFCALYGTDQDYRIARSRFARRLKSVYRLRWSDVVHTIGISKKTLWEWRKKDLERSEDECREVGAVPMSDKEWDDLKLLPAAHKAWIRRPS